MATVMFFLLPATVLAVLVATGVEAEYCYGTGRSYSTSCNYGCCINTWDGCCSYTYTYSSTYYSTAATIGIAVGCSITGLIIIGTIIAIICCCVKRRGSHGQVVTTFPAQPTVTTATTTNNMAVSGASGQYPMQPTGNPWYPTPQPYQYNPTQGASTLLAGPPSSAPQMNGYQPTYPQGYSQAAAQPFNGQESSQPPLDGCPNIEIKK